MKTILKFRLSQSNLGMLDLSVLFFRNKGLPVLIHLIRQMYLTGGKPTKAMVIAIKEFLETINQLQSNMGRPGVVKYLKGCSVLLQQIIAGHYIPDTTPLGLRIKRSRSGIPTIIPCHYRFAISNGEIRIIRL